MANPPITMAEPISVRLTPSEVRIAPGGDPVDLVAEVRNAGTTVDQYKIEIENLDPSWYTIIISAVALFPGNNAQIPIRLHPPRASNTLAGMYSFVVRARSQANPTLTGSARGTLEVTPYTVFKAELKPRRVTGRKGNYRLTLANEGNDEVQVELAGKDPDGTLNYDYKDSTPTVDPGDDATIPVTVKPSTFHFVGKNQHYMFEITAVPVDGNKEAAQTVTGELIHRAIFPNWFVPIFLGLVTVLIFLTLCGVWQSIQWGNLPVVGTALVPRTPTATATGTPLPVTVKKFDSSEDHIATGDSVTMSWRVSGLRPDTQVMIDGKPVSDKERAQGEITYTLKKTHKFELCAGLPTDPDNLQCQTKEVIVEVPVMAFGTGPAAPGGTTGGQTGGTSGGTGGTSGGGTSGGGTSGGGSTGGGTSGGGGATGGGGSTGGGTSGGGSTGGGTSGGGGATGGGSTGGGGATAPTQAPQQPAAPTFTPAPVPPKPTATVPSAKPATPTPKGGSDVQQVGSGGTPTPAPANHVKDPSIDNSAAIDGAANPTSAQTGDTITFQANKFASGEKVQFTIISPSYVTSTGQLDQPAAGDGSIATNLSIPSALGDKPANWGLWTVLYQGLKSNHLSIIYFAITPPTGPVACPVDGSRNGKAMPSNIAQGQRIIFEASGFKANEPISYWFTGPNGEVIGTKEPADRATREEDGADVPWVDAQGNIKVSQTLPLAPGNWVITFQGMDSKAQAVIRFCVSK